MGEGPRVPDTIGEKKMAELRRRAQAAQKESMFSRRQVAWRKADEKQRRNAGKN